ncbi:MAG: M28 family peptidase [Phycisphaera sp.]|nr:M28 family peptidase [Phycisphaera sp.]
MHSTTVATAVAPRRPIAQFSFVWSMASAVACAAIVATSPARAQETASAVAESAAAAVSAAPSTESRKLHEVIAAADPLVQEFNEHLTILASPWMEGRLPGTRGMERAMQYMEDQFARTGLEPGFQPSDGGPKTYRQPFPLGSSREVKLESITMRCGDAETALAAGTDFKFSSLGSAGNASGQLAFVGYGIEDGPDGFTSFAEGHSLEGKIALVLRFEPMDENGKSRWSGGDGWSGRAGFQGKLSAVARRKPSAILVVNTPGADDPRITSLGTGSGGRAIADVPVFMVSTEAGERLVKACGDGRSLMDLRRIADEPPADSPRSFDLADSRVDIAVEVEERSVIAENIIGVLPGRGALAKEVIVIGGHLDHLGMGDFGSREGPGKLHPGADDNASGSAGVILLGDLLKKDYERLDPATPLRTIVFIGFSAEESGLNGSRYYAQNPIYPIRDTVLMMNFDMIGRILNNRLSVTAAGAKGLEEWAQGFYPASGLTVVPRGGGGGGSDHASFLAVGVPILFAIIADFHDDYHTSRDVTGLIDREASVLAVRLWHQLALDMAQRAERFEPESAGGPMRPQPMRVRVGLRTRAADDGSGLEVVDVTSGGSADKAGIKQGDKIVKWNKKDMPDRNAFVEDLRTHEGGAVVQAVVLRGEEELTIYVTLDGTN